MDDPYENLSDEELKEIFEDMEADYWIDYYKSNYEQNGREWIWKSM